VLGPCVDIQLLTFDESNRLARCSRIERRKLIAAIGAERQGIDFYHCCGIEISIEMRKQRPAAGWLPLELVAERGCVHVEQYEIALAGKMFRRCFLDLCGAGEMDEAVAQVDFGAAEVAQPLDLAL